MNELKPEDVMKALECCATQAKCDGCVLENTPHCECELMEATLALLREKDATIKDYKKLLDTAIEGINHARDTVKQKDAEIERLSHQCSECAGCTQWKCDCSNIRAEAITEFAEKLKAFYHNLSGKTVGGSVAYHIDQIVKEMKGEQK